MVMVGADRWGPRCPLADDLPWIARKPLYDGGSCPTVQPLPPPRNDPSIIPAVNGTRILTPGGTRVPVVVATPSATKGVVMARRGRKRVVEREALYWRLIAEGMGTVAACREVGIGRKTGYRWRAELGGIRPPARPSAASSGRYLSRFDRQRIATLAAQGLSVREIARRIGRVPSTVSRELRRNCAEGEKVYDADLAQVRAEARTRRPKTPRPGVDRWLRDFVQAKLGQEWSPEQICGHLRATYPHDRSRQLSPETIYQALYLPGRGALSRELTRKLRTGRVLRRPHRRAEQRRSRFVDPEVLIAHSPVSARDRVEPGHGEGDLITGAGNRLAIGTVVERTSRYYLLLHLPVDYTAAAVRQALLEAFAGIPTVLRRTLTWDQGSEMA